MHMLQAPSIPIRESDAAHRAAQVRARIAAFRELAAFMRDADTTLILETMADYAASNADGDIAAVDLATRGGPG